RELSTSEFRELSGLPLGIRYVGTSPKGDVMRAIRAASMAVLLSSAAFSQSKEPGFEVASIKPNHSNSGRVMINRPDGGRFVTENTSLKMLITFAYDIRESQLSGGPAWMESERWDITAKPEIEIPRSDEGTMILKKMLQKLLAERFQLMVHK